jgi:hypothetical protein
MLTTTIAQNAAKNISWTEELAIGKQAIWQNEQICRLNSSNR